MLVLLALSCRPKLVIDDSPAAPDSAETAVDSVPCTLSTWYSDADGDGHGDPATAADACEAGAGQVTSNDDCDDTRATVYRGAAEYCNDLDDDCDGAVDEEAVDTSTWYADADGDSYGSADAPTSACSAGPGQVADATDCDDTDAGIYPGGPELADDGVDDDCDGRVDEVRVCADSTGDFTTIQSAVDAAPTDGATIEICPGTYYEAVTLGDRVIEIDGETGNPEDVVIDAAGIGWAVYAEGGSGSSYVVDGLTFIGDTGGAVWFVTAGPVRLAHYVIRDTQLEAAFGVLVVCAIPLETSDGEIFDNGATPGVEGALSNLLYLYAYSGTYYPTLPSFFQRTHVHDNGIGEDGVSQLVYQGGVRLNNNIFSNNSVMNDGIWFLTSGDSGFSTLYNNTFANNTVAAGALIQSDEYDPFDSPSETQWVRNNIFCNNSAANVIIYTGQGCSRCDTDNDGECSGDEAAAHCTIAVLDNNWFCEDRADICENSWCAAALAAVNWYGYDLGLSSTSDPPYDLPPSSPAIDGGDAAAEYNDQDGTRNNPGRYGGPNAFE